MSQTAPYRRPEHSEYAEYYADYINKVSGEDILEQMQQQISAVSEILFNTPEDDAGVLHPPYNWTIKQVVGHLADGERVFGYRAMRFASGDQTPLPGFEHDEYVEATDYETPLLRELSEELIYNRQANLSMFRRLRPDQWDRAGTASSRVFTVRALAYIMVGHINHHLRIIQERLDVESDATE